MTSDVAGQAPPDPIGAITRLVAEAEPALAAGLIQDIVIGVASGRANAAGSRKPWSSGLRCCAMDGHRPRGPSATC